MKFPFTGILLIIINKELNQYKRRLSQVKNDVKRVVESNVAEANNGSIGTLTDWEIPDIKDDEYYVKPKTLRIICNKVFCKEKFEEYFREEMINQIGTMENELEKTITKVASLDLIHEINRVDPIKMVKKKKIEKVNPLELEQNINYVDSIKLMKQKMKNKRKKLWVSKPKKTKACKLA